MRKLIYFPLVTTILFQFYGCAAQIKKEYNEAQRIMQTWVGASSSELIATRGAPDFTYQLEAEKVAYVYQKKWTTGNHGENKFSCTSTYIVNAISIIEDASFKWESVSGTNICRNPPRRN